MNKLFALLTLIQVLSINYKFGNENERNADASDVPRLIRDSSIYWLTPFRNPESRNSNKKLPSTSTNVSLASLRKQGVSSVQKISLHVVNALRELFEQKEKEILKTGQ